MTSEDQTSPGESPRRLTVALTAVAYLMVTLDALVVVTALPAIHRSFGGGIATLQWTVSAYSIAFGAGILTAAALGDRFGRRRVYVCGLALFATASAACAVAPNAAALVGFRTVQGIGASIVTPLGLTLLTSAFPAARRGAAVGIWGGVAGLGVACGPLLGGAITQGLSWHWIFWVNVPIGAVAAVGAATRLSESKGARARLDLPGLALVSGAVALLILGLVRGAQNGWSRPLTLGGLLGGLTLAAAFVASESFAAEPMIPLSLFRSGAFASAVVAQLAMGASIFSAAFLTSQFFQLALRDSPLATGLRLLPWTITPLLVAPLAGSLSDKVGARRLVVPGMLLQAGGFAWIVDLTAWHAHYSAWVVPLVIAGVGISMALPCVPAAGLRAAPPASLGKAAGVINTAQQFGAVLGVAIVTVVFDVNGNLRSPAAVASGYHAALKASAGLSLIAAFAGIGLRARSRKRQPAPAAHAGAAEPALATEAISV